MKTMNISPFVIRAATSRPKPRISSAAKPSVEPAASVISECSVKQVSLSIAIPAFNRCSSVVTLLESVCAQVGEQDEVIVSDDASTDGTTERSSAMPGVKVIQHATNQGMVPNWNE